MKLLDTHAHVHHKFYEDEFEEVINTLKEKDTVAINIAFDINSSKEVIELNKKYDFLLPVIGVHPNDSKGWTENSVKEVEELINDNVLAIGEIGLDYHFEGFDKEEQKKAFIDQIELAMKYKLPIVVHTRDSLEDCYEIVKNYPEQKFLLHSWSGDIEMTNKYISISENIYFSFNGILTFKNATMQQEVIKHIPMNRLMFETDCPWLSPMPERGKKNYPWKTQFVIDFASELLNIDKEDLNNINIENAKMFFNWK